ncbi:hypothetical protein COCSADRAFT_347387 [Bipolaris sorokiniana ND90Pr]|uniref:Uncharacterized protein n=1 Tax=Cochliobolus sativus (strain ND90Pr / ATCC 201652) TaxID=665912 RepID=M2SSF0_COCSN|nr:uncharacterized protein COCSADRAFT_347387 [Bipolaris sorokiniana ND90Pr]EMD59752.1 hypothetical protein COCSADRAFT_347387 [Bipolaris sorokiniana ND90Pr]
MVCQAVRRLLAGGPAGMLDCLERCLGPERLVLVMLWMDVKAEMPTQSGTRLGHKQRGSMMVPPVMRSTMTTQHARRHGGVRCLNAMRGTGVRQGRPAGAESPFDKPQRYSHPQDDGQWLWHPSSPLAPENTHTYAPPASPPLLPPTPLRRDACPAPSSQLPACAVVWHSSKQRQHQAYQGRRLAALHAATWPDADAPIRLAINPITLGHEPFRSVQGAENRIHQLCVLSLRRIMSTYPAIPTQG